MSECFLVSQHDPNHTLNVIPLSLWEELVLPPVGTWVQAQSSYTVELYYFYDMAPQHHKHRQLMLGTKTDGCFKHLANCLYALSITTTSDSLTPFSILAVLLYLSSTREEAWLCFRQSINFPLLRDNFSQHTRGVSTSPSHTCGEDRC